MRRLTIAAILLAFVLPLAALAQESPAPAASPSARPFAPLPARHDAATHHKITLDGREIAYTATAGTISLRNSENDPTASVFYVAYTADGVDAAKRPVTFCFNGGPGSSSMWLHVGSFGPKRVAMPDARVPSPNPPLVDNAESILDLTDLVFIDAVGTGYSIITGRGEGKQFFGVDEDAQAFAQFVKRWTTQTGRWGSPKYLFGESYGTTRASNLVNRLQNDGMAFDGVVLVSSALDYNALDIGQSGGEDLQYLAFLPTLAAVAHYHHRAGGPADIAHFADEVRRFTAGPYAQALLEGDRLDTARRRQVAAQLHAYTGLPDTFILNNDLRIDPGRFEAELLRDQGKVVGRLDGRYTGIALDRGDVGPNYDPTDAAIGTAFVGALNRYMRDDLHFHDDREYLGTNYRVVNANWNFVRRGHEAAAVSVTDDLHTAMTKNPYLRVFSANGYYDLATPFYGTEYTLGHLGLDPSLRRNISYGFYPSGHMIYLEDASRRAMKRDLAAWYRAAK